MKREVIEKVLCDVKSDLESINSTSNERLLKEEQVRSAIYCSLKSQGFVVSCERNYSSSSEIECDLVFWRNDEAENWLEIKTARYSVKKRDERRRDKKGNDSWSNAPKEQVDSWIKDIEKLRKQTKNGVKRYFVLVEQYYEDSLFTRTVDGVYEHERFEVLKRVFKNEINKSFDLKWNKAPVDKCIIRIFKV